VDAIATVCDIKCSILVNCCSALNFGVDFAKIFGVSRLIPLDTIFPFFSRRQQSTFFIHEGHRDYVTRMLKCHGQSLSTI